MRTSLAVVLGVLIGMMVGMSVLTIQAYPPVDSKHKQNVCGNNKEFQDAYDKIITGKSGYTSFDEAAAYNTYYLKIMLKCIGDNTTYKEKKGNEGQFILGLPIIQEAYGQDGTSQPVDYGVLINAVIAIMTAIPSVALTFAMMKQRLGAVRQFVDVLDDALKDDRISDGEYIALHEKLKRMVK